MLGRVALAFWLSLAFSQEILLTTVLRFGCAFTAGWYELPRWGSWRSAVQSDLLDKLNALVLEFEIADSLALEGGAMGDFPLFCYSHSPPFDSAIP